MNELITAAVSAREHARATFSNFKVGAALQALDGSIYTGCNVENATYGLSICAERVAVFKAISEGARRFARIVVVADTEKLTPPCGACRQILWEMCGNIEVVLANIQGDSESFRMKDLFRDHSMRLFWISAGTARTNTCATAATLAFFTVLLCYPLHADAVDTIITARYVVTMDAQKNVIENGAVAIRVARILALGPAAEMLRLHTARATIRRPNAIIAPGLINTHTHAPMSLFRGIADDLRLQDWLEKFIFPAEAKNVSPEFVRAGTRLACLEMLLSGTTTYADMYYFEEVIAEATKEAGMRGVLGQTIIGFPVPDAKTPEAALRRAEAFIQRFANDPLIVPAVAPHAVYTNSDETIVAARTLANRYDVPLLIHLSETRRENDELAAKRSITPTQLLDKLGIFKGRTLAAHAVWMNDADIAILAKRGVGVAHCPSSNMKLASGVAPVMKFIRAGVRLGLGTDGVAGSNNDVSMFEEMDLAAKLQKVTLNDPEALTAVQAMEMATIGGAKALSMDARIGSLEPGKQADLIAVRLAGAHATPMYNVYSHLVYALKGSDVTDVMIGGRVVVRDRTVLTLKPAQVLGDARKMKDAVVKSLGR